MNHNKDDTNAFLFDKEQYNITSWTSYESQLAELKARCQSLAQDLKYFEKFGVQDDAQILRKLAECEHVLCQLNKLKHVSTDLPIIPDLYISEISQRSLSQLPSLKKLHMTNREPIVVDDNVMINSKSINTTKNNVLESPSLNCNTTDTIEGLWFLIKERAMSVLSKTQKNYDSQEDNVDSAKSFDLLFLRLWRMQVVSAEWLVKVGMERVQRREDQLKAIELEIIYSIQNKDVSRLQKIIDSYKKKDNARSTSPFKAIDSPNPPATNPFYQISVPPIFHKSTQTDFTDVISCPSTSENPDEVNSLFQYDIFETETDSSSVIDAELQVVESSDIPKPSTVIVPQYTACKNSQPQLHGQETLLENLEKNNISFDNNSLQSCKDNIKPSFSCAGNFNTKPIRHPHFNNSLGKTETTDSPLNEQKYSDSGDANTNDSTSDLLFVTCNMDSNIDSFDTETLSSFVSGHSKPNSMIKEMNKYLVIPDNGLRLSEKQLNEKPSDLLPMIHDVNDENIQDNSNLPSPTNVSMIPIVYDSSIEKRELLTLPYADFNLAKELKSEEILSSLAKLSKQCFEENEPLEDHVNCDDKIKPSEKEVPTGILTKELDNTHTNSFNSIKNDNRSENIVNPEDKFCSDSTKPIIQNEASGESVPVYIVDDEFDTCVTQDVDERETQNTLVFITEEENSLKPRILESLTTDELSQVKIQTNAAHDDSDENSMRQFCELVSKSNPGSMTDSNDMLETESEEPVAAEKSFQLELPTNVADAEPDENRTKKFPLAESQSCVRDFLNSNKESEIELQKPVIKDESPQLEAATNVLKIESDENIFSKNYFGEAHKNQESNTNPNITLATDVIKPVIKDDSIESVNATSVLDNKANKSSNKNYFVEENQNSMGNRSYSDNEFETESVEPVANDKSLQLKNSTNVLDDKSDESLSQKCFVEENQNNLGNCSYSDNKFETESVEPVTNNKSLDLKNPTNALDDESDEDPSQKSFVVENQHSVGNCSYSDNEFETESVEPVTNDKSLKLKNPINVFDDGSDEDPSQKCFAEANQNSVGNCSYFDEEFETDAVEPSTNEKSLKLKNPTNVLDNESDENPSQKCSVEANQNSVGNCSYFDEEFETDAVEPSTNEKSLKLKNPTNVLDNESDENPSQKCSVEKNQNSVGNCSYSDEEFEFDAVKPITNEESLKLKNPTNVLDDGSDEDPSQKCFVVENQNSVGNCSYSDEEFEFDAVKPITNEESLKLKNPINVFDDGSDEDPSQKCFAEANQNSVGNCSYFDEEFETDAVEPSTNEKSLKLKNPTNVLDNESDENPSKKCSVEKNQNSVGHCSYSDEEFEFDAVKPITNEESLKLKNPTNALDDESDEDPSQKSFVVENQNSVGNCSYSDNEFETESVDPVTNDKSLKLKNPINVFDDGSDEDPSQKCFVVENQNSVGNCSYSDNEFETESVEPVTNDKSLKLKNPINVFDDGSDEDPSQKCFAEANQNSVGNCSYFDEEFETESVEPVTNDKSLQLKNSTNVLDDKSDESLSQKCFVEENQNNLGNCSYSDNKFETESVEPVTNNKSLHLKNPTNALDDESDEDPSQKSFVVENQNSVGNCSYSDNEFETESVEPVTNDKLLKLKNPINVFDDGSDEDPSQKCFAEANQNSVGNCSYFDEEFETESVEPVTNDKSLKLKNPINVSDDGSDEVFSQKCFVEKNQNSVGDCSYLDKELETDAVEPVTNDESLQLKNSANVLEDESEESPSQKCFVEENQHSVGNCSYSDDEFETKSVEPVTNDESLHLKNTANVLDDESEESSSKKCFVEENQNSMGNCLYLNKDFGIDTVDPITNEESLQSQNPTNVFDNEADGGFSKKCFVEKDQTSMAKCLSSGHQLENESPKPVTKDETLQTEILTKILAAESDGNSFKDNYVEETCNNKGNIAETKDKLESELVERVAKDESQQPEISTHAVDKPSDNDFTKVKDVNTIKEMSASVGKSNNKTGFEPVEDRKKDNVFSTEISTDRSNEEKYLVSRKKFDPVKFVEVFDAFPILNCCNLNKREDCFINLKNDAECLTVFKRTPGNTDLNLNEGFVDLDKIEHTKFDCHESDANKIHEEQTENGVYLKDGTAKVDYEKKELIYNALIALQCEGENEGVVVPDMYENHSASEELKNGIVDKLHPKILRTTNKKNREEESCCDTISETIAQHDTKGTNSIANSLDCYTNETQRQNNSTALMKLYNQKVGETLSFFKNLALIENPLMSQSPSLLNSFPVLVEFLFKEKRWIYPVSSDICNILKSIRKKNLPFVFINNGKVCFKPNLTREFCSLHEIVFCGPPSQDDIISYRIWHTDGQQFYVKQNGRQFLPYENIEKRFVEQDGETEKMSDNTLLPEDNIFSTEVEGNQETFKFSLPVSGSHTMKKEDFTIEKISVSPSLSDSSNQERSGEKLYETIFPDNLTENRICEKHKSKEKPKDMCVSLESMAGQYGLKEGHLDEADLKHIEELANKKNHVVDMTDSTTSNLTDNSKVVDEIEGDLVVVFRVKRDMLKNIHTENGNSTDEYNTKNRLNPSLKTDQIVQISLLPSSNSTKSSDVILEKVQSLKINSAAKPLKLEANAIAETFQYNSMPAPILLTDLNKQSFKSEDKKWYPEDIGKNHLQKKILKSGNFHTTTNETNKANHLKTSKCYHFEKSPKGYEIDQDNIFYSNKKKYAISDSEKKETPEVLTSICTIVNSLKRGNINTYLERSDYNNEDTLISCNEIAYPSCMPLDSTESHQNAPLMNKLVNIDELPEEISYSIPCKPENGQILNNLEKAYAPLFVNIAGAKKFIKEKNIHDTNTETVRSSTLQVLCSDPNTITLDTTKNVNDSIKISMHQSSLDNTVETLWSDEYSACSSYVSIQKKNCPSTHQNKTDIAQKHASPKYVLLHSDSSTSQSEARTSNLQKSRSNLSGWSIETSDEKDIVPEIATLKQGQSTDSLNEFSCNTRNKKTYLSNTENINSENSSDYFLNHLIDQHQEMRRKALKSSEKLSQKVLNRLYSETSTCSSPMTYSKKLSVITEKDGCSCKSLSTRVPIFKILRQCDSSQTSGKNLSKNLNSSFTKNNKQRKRNQYDTEQKKNEKTRPKFLKQIPLSKSKPKHTYFMSGLFLNVKKPMKQMKKRRLNYRGKNVSVIYHKKMCVKKNSFDVQVQHIIAKNNHDKIQSSICFNKNVSINSSLVQINCCTFPITNIFSNLVTKHNSLGTTKITFENFCHVAPKSLSQDLVISQKTSCKGSVHSVTIESFQLNSENKSIHTVPSWLSILLCYDDDEINEFFDECFDLKRIFYGLVAAKYLC